MGTTSADGLHRVAIEGFSLQVAQYEAARPTYPDAALEDMVLRAHVTGDGRVLDLAAGTGKWTRRLAERGNLDITAVEPNAEMRATFTQLQPDIEILDGSATRIPAPDSTFDAVTVAQAFHWFANEASLREICRVLRPGGCLALIWNIEDKTVPWIQEMMASVEAHSVGVPSYWKGEWKQAFRSPAAAQMFDLSQGLNAYSRFHSHTLAITREQCWGRIGSKSYIAILPPETRAAVRREVEGVIKSNGVRFERDAKGREVTDVPLRTEVFVVQTLK